MNSPTREINGTRMLLLVPTCCVHDSEDEIKPGAYLCAAIDGNSQSASVIKHQLAKFHG